MAAASRFKSPQGEAAYLAAYDATLKRWPVPHEATDVETRFGTTHVNIAGSPDAPPLVLIHGYGVSSTQWYSNIEPLSRLFRVYMPDVIDQMGRSLPRQQLLNRPNSAAWLTDVLDALSIDRTAMVGHSNGGWLTLNLALAAPQRIERMVLLSPAASFAPISWRFIATFAPAVLIPTRSMLYRSFQKWTTQPLTDGEAIVEQLYAGIKGFKGSEMGAPTITVFTDDELKQLTMPTLLLVGDKDITCTPSRVLERAQRLMPNIKAEIIADGGHWFPTDQAEITNARMLDFLKQPT